MAIITRYFQYLIHIAWIFAQKSYLETLAEGTDEKVDENLTKAEAAKKIGELQKANKTQHPTENDDVSVSNEVKNPDEWKTGDEPMTGAQKSYLKTLSDEAGEDLDENMTKAQASKRIDELQQKTGRGK